MKESEVQMQGDRPNCMISGYSKELSVQNVSYFMPVIFELFREETYLDLFTALQSGFMFGLLNPSCTCGLGGLIATRKV